MPSLDPRPSPLPPRPWMLRRADQSTVAVLIFFILAAMSAWWMAKGGYQNRLVEADDDARQRVVRFQVDVNAADRFELIQLPGIGDTLAQRIIEIRQTNGPFAEVEDLRRVRGIGPKILERLRPHLLPIKKVDK